MKYFIGLFLVYSACTTPVPKPNIYQPSQTDRKRTEFRAEGKNGMVASAHPIASEAGLKMLKIGGNAVDAAVATSFAISVVRPQSTGIGGGGFMLFFDAERDTTKVYDFRERAPIKASRNMYIGKRGKPKDFYYRGKRVKNASVNGHLAVGTPGLVAGLVDVHKAYGKLPLKTVMAPAIDAAERGFRVYKGLAKAIELRKKVLKVFPGSRRIFFPEGRQLRLGDFLIQKDLAKTLKIISLRGKDGFYKGSVARKIVREMRRGGGVLTQKDLDQYIVRMRTPVVGKFQGYKIVSMPPPSSGGVHIVQMLNMLEELDYADMEYNSVERIHTLAEVMRRAFADRSKYLGDPDFVKVPVVGLTSRKYAKGLIKNISPEKASDSKKIFPGDPYGAESHSTTHISVTDKWGNAISSTQTVNFYFGSGVVAQGTGIVLNDEMDDFSKQPGKANVFGLLGSEANAIAAKKTMLSSMSPTIVFDEKNKVSMVLGSPGGPRIINATLQTILNKTAFKMPIYDAVHATRIHHQWFPDQISVESERLPKEILEGLEKLGHKLHFGYNYGDNIGDVQAIAKENGMWIGVSDTRAEGHPKGY